MSANASNTVSIRGTKDRQLTNLSYGKYLIKQGLYIFASSGKTPLVPRFNQIDTEISKEAREQAIEEYEAKHDAQPVHVGATKDPAVVSKMFKKYPNCVWSIACGPSKLVVIDADSKDNGPELIGKHFDEHGLPEGCIVVPTQSGGRHYIFRDPDNKFTNAAGLLKKQYGCDVRGAGGQYIAPGSIREDGKTYGSKKDLMAFGNAYRDGTLPELPDHIVELIGSGGEASQTVDTTELGTVIKQLEDTDWPDHVDLFEPGIGEYDLQALKDSNSDFAELYDNPSSDCSDNRWKLAQLVMREYRMSAVDLAVLFGGWEGAGMQTEDGKGAGNYNLRDIAREWIKNKARFTSKGDAMGAVIDEGVDDRAAYIANGGSETGWIAWQERLERDRQERLARSQKASTTNKFDRLMSRFTYIENLRGMAIRALDWCVKFFVARGTTSVATGMWGAGKTAVFSDIGLHVGHGFEWRGRKVSKGVVVYVALENPEDVDRRVTTWCEIMEKSGRDLSGGAFLVYRGPCCLFDPSGKATQDEKDLITVAKMAEDHYGLPVAMIIIDTLAMSIMPGNDNDARDAGIFTAAMQRIVAATGANVTALAHPTKNGQGVRGSGALQANVDTVIEVVRDAVSGIGSVQTGSKFRIGDPAKVKFKYKLKSHTVGLDEDGEDVVVVLAEDVLVPTFSVHETQDDEEVPSPTDTPADKLTATLRVFRERAEAIAADTGEKPKQIGLSKKMVLDALNVDRKRRGHGEIKDPTVVTRLLGRLVDAGEIVKSGDNRGTEYRVA